MRRSDFFQTPIKTEFIPSRLDNYRANDSQYLQEDELDTTTETSEDYLSHDIESVDRLALDGETREPISSSTIDTYNY